MSLVMYYTLFDAVCMLQSMKRKNTIERSLLFMTPRSSGPQLSPTSRLASVIPQRPPNGRESPSRSPIYLAMVDCMALLHYMVSYYYVIHHIVLIRSYHITLDGRLSPAPLETPPRSPPEPTREEKSRLAYEQEEKPGRALLV